MVKKDLQRVGIPYENDQGIADFHAAGRHTHITELLRNGVSVPEARELARHSDVRMTMKYTHIELEDQARAVKKLPWKSSGGKAAESGDSNGWQRYGSGTRRSNGQSVPPGGNGTTSSRKNIGDANDDLDGSCGNACRGQTSTGTRHAPVEAAGIEPAT